MDSAGPSPGAASPRGCCWWFRLSPSPSLVSADASFSTGWSRRWRIEFENMGSNEIMISAAEGSTRVCVATLLAWRVFGDFHDPFGFQWSCSPVRFGFPLRGVFSAGSEPPHARQVQRRRCQGKLRGYFSQPAHPESPHPSLLFQNPDDRLCHCFPPPV